MYLQLDYYLPRADIPNTNNLTTLLRDLQRTFVDSVNSADHSKAFQFNHIIAVNKIEIIQKCLVILNHLIDNYA